MLLLFLMLPTSVVALQCATCTLTCSEVTSGFDVACPSSNTRPRSLPKHRTSPLCLWLLSSIPVYHHRSSFELAASAAACSILPSCCCFMLSTLVVSSSPFSTPRARSRIARALPAAVLRDHRYSEVTSLSTELFYLLASRTERPIPPVLSALSAVAARATRALPFVMPRARPL